MRLQFILKCSNLVLRTKIHSRQTALTKPCHKLLTNRRHRAINSSPTCFMRIIIHAETLSANRKPDYGVAEETFTPRTTAVLWMRSATAFLGEFGQDNRIDRINVSKSCSSGYPVKKFHQPLIVGQIDLRECRRALAFQCLKNQYNGARPPFMVNLHGEPSDPLKHIEILISGCDLFVLHFNKLSQV